MTRKEKIALLIDELGDIRCNNFDADTDEDKTLKEAVRVIKALEQEPNCPYYIIDEDGHGLCKNHRALEQEPKTGHWIDLDGTSAVCSCCYKNNLLYGDFCKWCGAKMVEPQESEG